MAFLLSPKFWNTNEVLYPPPQKKKKKVEHNQVSTGIMLIGISFGYDNLGKLGCCLFEQF